MSKKKSASTRTRPTNAAANRPRPITPAKPTTKETGPGPSTDEVGPSTDEVGPSAS